MSVRFHGTYGGGWASHYSWVGVVYYPESDKLRVIRRWKQTSESTGKEHAPSFKSINAAMPEILARARWTYENLIRPGNLKGVQAEAVDASATDGTEASAPHLAALCERCTHLGHPCNRKRAVK